MKTRYFQTAIIIVFMGLLLSCEKTAENIDVPNYTAKLVLHAFISPSDSLIRVHVSTTSNIYGKLTSPPSNLPVKLTLIDGENSLPFADRDSTGVCSLKYRVSAGKKYTIEARCPGYPNVTGTCTVPEQENIDIKMDTSTLHFSNQWGNYSQPRITAKFKDTPGKADYYNMYGYVVYINHYGTSSDPLRIENKNNDGSFRNLIISDKQIDGEILTVNFDGGFYYNASDTSLVSMEYKACILKTDLDYYQYHTSLMKYQDSSNPFTEFLPVYSNIKGGYGVFCSFIKYEQTFKVK
jgi:hypothetical protein